MEVTEVIPSNHLNLDLVFIIQEKTFIIKYIPFLSKHRNVFVAIGVS